MTITRRPEPFLGVEGSGMLSLANDGASLRITQSLLTVFILLVGFGLAGPGLGSLYFNNPEKYASLGMGWKGLWFFISGAATLALVGTIKKYFLQNPSITIAGDAIIFQTPQQEVKRFAASEVKSVFITRRETSPGAGQSGYNSNWIPSYILTLKLTSGEQQYACISGSAPQIETIMGFMRGCGYPTDDTVVHEQWGTGGQAERL